MFIFKLELNLISLLKFEIDFIYIINKKKSLNTYFTSEIVLIKPRHPHPHAVPKRVLNKHWPRSFGFFQQRLQKSKFAAFAFQPLRFEKLNLRRLKAKTRMIFRLIINKNYQDLFNVQNEKFPFHETQVPLLVHNLNIFLSAAMQSSDLKLTAQLISLCPKAENLSEHWALDGIVQD
ncbi:hypothetical protein BpHYR1_025064 [Brachionus plicatilis]|uniref:Uncharacterized protein n=1 Tax=Brachionus plicatilis TaxID=10195 RepID=A0A3M7SEA7_BRAPC|nr:hypothetical protein BpHYR1_025064 [Brachionus plicatilis]